MTASSTHGTTPQQLLAPELAEKLRSVPIFASISDQDLTYFASVPRRQLALGEAPFLQGELTRTFWVVLSGSLRLTWKVANGAEQTVYTYRFGETFGEVALLANLPSTTSLYADEASEVLEFGEEKFWKMMNLCPEVRREVLGKMAYRLAKMQVGTFQQEKMAALGTMAAGLMHELNNPGAAARRAAAQLRENFVRMHALSARWAKQELTPAQKECMISIQDSVLATRPTAALTSLEQSDREEALAEWMDTAGVEQAWKLAPTFVSVGLTEPDFACAQRMLDPTSFSDACSWLEAMVSSLQLVGTIEESVGRVSDLVLAVKSYAYEGRGGNTQTIDVNRSILATVLILGHKLREKQITLDKQLDRSLPPLDTSCQGVNQIWTNLLDNAIDAAPQGGRIVIRTWADRHPAPLAGGASRVDLCILIADNGTGIPADCQAKIFDPFFTTKPVGVGTGLGLGIVYRIVEQCGGAIHFSSTPGETEFAVRLPATA